LKNRREGKGHVTANIKKKKTVVGGQKRKITQKRATICLSWIGGYQKPFVNQNLGKEKKGIFAFCYTTRS